MSGNTICGFIISTGLAFIAGMWLVGTAWDVPKLKEDIAQCQKDLPRSQKCELIAVVKK